MAEQILKDATQLGSTLTSFASRQLESVLDELRGPLGDGRRLDEGSGASLGSLAGNALQIVGQVGSLLTQLSQYDLVRNANVLQLSSTNSISSSAVRPHEQTPYAVLVENGGRKALEIVLVANIHEHSPFYDQALEVDVGERRRCEIPLPALKSGTWTLLICAYDKSTYDSKDRKMIAKKVVALNVLPAPQQHNL